MLTAAVAAGSLLLWVGHLNEDALLTRPQLPWWALVFGFFIAELAVVHLRFGQDAHSFSMSEIPLVLGLFFSSPADLLLGLFVGNIAVFAITRRLPALKLAFNMSQFVLQGALAITVFRAMADLGEPLGLAGWLGAVSGCLAAVIVADLLIDLAIRLTGGRVPLRDVLLVAGLSALAASMNASLAVSGVVILSTAPGSAGLGLLPPVILFLAYRAYVSQRQERSRLESLYEATQALHRSPQIEAALVAAAKDATRMLDAAFAEILLFPDGGNLPTYWTAVGPGDRLIVMEQVDLAPGAWQRLIDRGKATLLDAADATALNLPPSDRSPLREAVVAPLTRGGNVVGVIAVFNRVGDISTFGADEIPLLDTLAAQLSVSLENGRLEDSLAQLTELKNKLEELIRSKDQFVATVSHELRTPLTAVVGLSQELHDNWSLYESSDARDMVDLIANQSTELAHIIEDLLVAARADIGTLTFKPAEVDLRDELQAVVAGHCSGRPGDPPDLVVEPGAEKAWTDPLRFRQIVRNLLANADRYGGRRVCVVVERREENVAVRVMDDGAGVPAGMEEAIFEPYQSAHERGSQPSSVGLGLAVSRKLARLMDGDLVYTHAAGITAFELTVPTEASARLPQRSVFS